MAELAAQYIELYAKVHKKSWQRDAWLLAKEVVPMQGTRKAHDIRLAVQFWRPRCRPPLLTGYSRHLGW